MSESNGKNSSGSQSSKAKTGQGIFGNSCLATPSDVILAAATLALTVSNGRTQYEIETLINLFSLTTSNLQSILAQILINNKSKSDIDVSL